MLKNYLLVALLGLISYTTNQRTREIGIRKIMGAGPGYRNLLTISIFRRAYISWF